MKFSDLEKHLGSEAKTLLGHTCRTVPKARLHLPGPDFINRVWRDSDRSISVLRNLQTTLSHGRLGGTGYLSILPVDQGIEHSAGASFAPNPDYFDPENIVKLAVEGGCNAVAVGVGATIYFGSPESGRQIEEISRSFAVAHELGMYTVLWCYLRNPAFKTKEKDFHLSADLTGQANHLGSTIQADIIKQKLPENNGGYTALRMGGSDYGKSDPRIYSELSSDHPIDLCRYQVLNCFAGRAGLI
ncbi:MAG: fructose-bisphosphate aldolase, partial [Verrucomicrobia bacterium]|nr:fructose-bisphosphate aldolase [Verrucomicrobiota bacterium]